MCDISSLLLEKVLAGHDGRHVCVHGAGLDGRRPGVDLWVLFPQLLQGLPVPRAGGVVTIIKPRGAHCMPKQKFIIFQKYFNPFA